MKITLNDDATITAGLAIIGCWEPVSGGIAVRVNPAKRFSTKKLNEAISKKRKQIEAVKQRCLRVVCRPLQETGQSRPILEEGA